MVSLARSKAVLELGKKLVDQLEVHDDLLALWMSHYVAQRIEEAAQAPTDAKLEAQDACAKAILELWRHRSSLPGRVPLFDDLEAIQRTLSSLDVSNKGYRYHPDVLREALASNVDGKAKQWLEIAFGLDYSARILISSALREAAEEAAENIEPWVDLAHEAGAEDGVELAIVQFVRNHREMNATVGGDRDAELKDQLARLEGFAELALGVARDIRGELGLSDADKLTDATAQ